jgi:hypothetical protein
MLGKMCWKAGRLCRKMVYFVFVIISKPVMVAKQSKAWTVFTCQTLWSWVRIPLRAWMFGVYMCLFCLCAVLCLGRGLATSWSLVQGVLPIVNRSGNWKEARAHKGCRAIQEAEEEEEEEEEVEESSFNRIVKWKVQKLLEDPSYAMYDL